MPTAPTRRLMTTRKSGNRKRYMALPRTISSSGDTFNPKISLQFMAVGKESSMPEIICAPAVGARRQSEGMARLARLAGKSHSRAERNLYAERSCTYVRRMAGRGNFYQRWYACCVGCYTAPGRANPAGNTSHR